MEFSEWKIWNGGECPVGKDTKVHVQWRERSREWTEKNVNSCLGVACSFTWKHINSRGDIIAYREVIEPKVLEVVWYCTLPFDKSGAGWWANPSSCTTHKLTIKYQEGTEEILDVKVEKL